jgi:hypothetical protein
MGKGAQMKDTCKSEVCPYHNCAIFGTAKVIGEISERVDNQESFCNMLHDKISILTKRVEHLEQQYGWINLLLRKRIKNNVYLG